MIRILHNVGSLAAGGMESYIMNIYRNIDRTKIQFDFVVGDETNYYEDEIKELGGIIYRIPTSITAPYRFYKLLSKHPEYTIVHSHRDAISSLYLLAAHFAKVKVCISHSHSSQKKGIAKLIASTIKWIIPYVTTDRLACGKEAGAWLYGRNNYRIVPNSIDCSKFAYNPSLRSIIRKELNIDEDDVVIGHVGRFEIEKNHKYILDVFSSFVKKHPKAKLVCAGSGSLFNSIIEYSIELGTRDNCLLLGNRKDIYQLLQAFDIILFPSLYEGFSIAMLEFQAAGLPILCSDTIPKEINLNNNIVFKSLNDPIEEWADALEKITKTINMRDETSNNCIKQAGYDIHDTAIKMQQFYIDKA